MREFNSNLQRDGFSGTLYQPDHNRFPGKAVIVADGGDGMFSLTESGAERLAQEGMTALQSPVQRNLPQALVQRCSPSQAR